MKILQINAVANSGSTGRIAEEIGQIIQKRGWDSYIAYGRWKCNSNSNLIRIGTFWDIGWHALQTRLFDSHGLFSVRATKTFIRQINRLQPDIIHLHNIHGYYLNYPLLFEYLASSNIPVVWTLHDCWAVTGHCVHFQNVNCNKWKVMCERCPNSHDYPSSWLLDCSKRNYLKKKLLFTSLNNLTIVPVCSWLDNIVEQSFLLNAKREVITNGIDINIFCPTTDYFSLVKQWNLLSKFVVLAIASNWNITKGEQDIYYLADKVPEDVVFIMIGLSKDQINTLPKNIIGLERTEDLSQLVRFYSLANVFINPTYQDTFPTVNIEALACGTPVLTYNTGGCAEAITDEVGIVVDRGDRLSLLSALKKMKSRTEKINSQKCRQRVIEFYDKNDRYLEYIELYNKILNNK